MKKKNDELVGKLSAVEQLNAKYKAKLKQLLGKQKVETSANKTNKTSTPESTVQTDENEQAAFGRNETMLNEVLFEISSHFTYTFTIINRNKHYPLICFNVLS